MPAQSGPDLPPITLLLRRATEGDRGALDEVYGVGTQTVSGGGFVFDFPSAYQRNYMQSISWFIDSDGDGVCSAAAGEHVGQPGAKALRSQNHPSRTRKLRSFLDT